LLPENYVGPKGEFWAEEKLYPWDDSKQYDFSKK
jgi:hypothetical protein